MGDNDSEQYLDEEYHFAEEPDMGMAAPSQDKKSESTITDSAKPRFDFNMQKLQDFFSENSPARNAVVVVGILIVLFIVYQIISGLFFSGKNEVAFQKSQVKQPVIQPMPKAVQQPITVPAPAQTAVINDIDGLKARFIAMEQHQTTLQDQVSSINNQLSSLNTNLNLLATKLTQMNQQLIHLNGMVQEQAQHVALFKAHLQAKPKITKRIYPHAPSIIYYLKAVIPGRAWLIASNGSTMTVRVGTPITGYGVVRFIDAVQGRVLTSSGKLIRFSQDDS